MPRPVNLALTSLRFPLTAIGSILHRLSGLALLFGTVFFVYVADVSLSSSDAFLDLKRSLRSPILGFFFWFVTVSACYHFIAGIRHLIMDFHVGTSLRTARLTSMVVLVLTLFYALAVGAWLLGVIDGL